MPLLLSLFFGFVPAFFFAWIVYWMDRYEKEPKLLLGGVFLWGAVVAAGAAYVINSVLGLGVFLLTNSEITTDLTTGSIVAPLVEESLKGLAVLLVFLIFRSEFDSLLDGVIYAGIVALGFAATENAYYIYTMGFKEAGYTGLFGMVFVRVIMVGWQHPFYTAFIGIGLAVARLNRSWLVRAAAPLAGWSAAVFTHAFHNTLGSLLAGGLGMCFASLLDWSGWFFMLAFILWATWREQRWIIQHLREEVALGVISLPQYHTACSGWAQSVARFTALMGGQYRSTLRFYQLCASLAHKKQHLASLGDESGNRAAVERLRAELKRLSPYAHA